MPSNERLASPTKAEPVAVITRLFTLPVIATRPSPIKLDLVINFILSGVSDVSNTKTKSASPASVTSVWSLKISSSIDVAFTLVSKS